MVESRDTYDLRIELRQARLPAVVEDKHSINHLAARFEELYSDRSGKYEI